MRQHLGSEAHPKRVAEQNVDRFVLVGLVRGLLVPQIKEEIAKVLQPVPQGHFRQRIEEQMEDLLVSQIKEVIVSGTQLYDDAYGEKDTFQKWMVFNVLFFCYFEISGLQLSPSPLHCRIESLCLHASLVHIECPVGSRAEPATWSVICWPSAAGRVATIAKTKIADDTIPSGHITQP